MSAEARASNRPGAERAVNGLIAVCAVLAIVHLGRLAYEAAARALQFDDFIDLHLAWLISQGEFPWTNLLNPHGSLECWPLAGLVTLCGGELVAQRWALWLFFGFDIAIVLIVGYHFARRGLWAEAIVAVFLVVGSPLLRQHLGDVRGEVLAAVVLLMAAEIAGSGARAGPLGLLVSGGLLGAGFLMNQKCLVFYPPFVLALFLASGWRRGLRDAATVGAGTILVLGAFAAFLRSHGVLGPFWHETIVVPIEAPIHPSMRHKVLSSEFLGTLISINFSFALCLLWALGREIERLSGRRPSLWTTAEPTVGGPLPWPESESTARAFDLCLALGSVGMLFINPFPHPYNYLLIGPFLVLLAAPAVTGMIRAFFHRPRSLIAALLMTGFLIADVGLPFRVGRHSLDGSAQAAELARVQALTAGDEPIFDSCCRFFRPTGSRAVPIVEWSVELFRQRIVPPVSEELPATRCHVVYWDRMLEQFLPPSDRDFVLRHYLIAGGATRVAGCWVRTASPGQPASFEIAIPGHYWVVVSPPGLSPVKVSIDGRPVGSDGKAPLPLDKGAHTLVTDGTDGRSVAVVARPPGPDGFPAYHPPDR